MALNDIQQLHKLINDSKHILLVCDQEKNDDAIASALALKIFLEKQNKQADVACDGFSPPKHLKFLPGLEDIKPALANLQKLIIKVDVSKAKLETISYDVKDNVLSIHLTPQQGIITKDDLRTAQSSFKYDLVIALGAKDMESMGNIFLQNTDLFYRAPVINLDHHTGNEHFGQLNIIDITAASTAEIVFKIIEQLASARLEEKIATCLLTGMISQTRSFQTPNVTPNTLNTAGKLMQLGAEREQIVHHLYRTRSLATLKLWGKALSNLQTDRAIGLVWAAITRDDLVRAGATEDDLQGIISELIGNSPEAKLILMLNEYCRAENANKIHGFLAVDQEYDALQLLQPLHPQGNKKSASVILENTSLREAEEKIIASIKKQLGTARN